jgi:hypothetical protein
MMQADLTNADDPEMVALGALTWLLSDERRAERLLAITGLDPETLRARAGTRDLLAAVIGFLEGHEPDLIACAAAMGIKPESLIAVGRALE